MSRKALGDHLQYLQELYNDCRIKNIETPLRNKEENGDTSYQPKNYNLQSNSHGNSTGFKLNSNQITNNTAGNNYQASKGGLMRPFSTTSTIGSSVATAIGYLQPENLQNRRSYSSLPMVDVDSPKDFAREKSPYMPEKEPSLERPKSNIETKKHASMGLPKPMSNTANKTVTMTAAQMALYNNMHAGAKKKIVPKALERKLASITSIFPFTWLPDDIQYHISGFLATDDFVNLSHSSKDINIRFDEALNSRYLLYFGIYPKHARKVTLKALSKTEDLSSENVLRLFLMSAARGYVYFLQQILTAFSNPLSSYRSIVEHKAGINAFLACVISLINTPGIDINKQNKSGRSPLSLACESGHQEIVQSLLNYTPPDTSDHPEGANVEQTGLQKVDVLSLDEHSRSALFFACTRGHIEIVKLLVKSGADFSVNTDTLMTPVFAAASGGFVELVSYLITLQPAIDLDLQSNTGKTALYAAVELGHASTVEVLLNANADFNKETFRGKIPLYAAAEQGHVEIVKLLLKYCKQADIFKLTSYGTTPMFIASKQSNQTIKNLFCDFVSKRTRVNLKTTVKKSKDSIDDEGVKIPKQPFQTSMQEKPVETPRFLEDVETLRYQAHQRDQLRQGSDKIRRKKEDEVTVTVSSESASTKPPRLTAEEEKANRERKLRLKAKRAWEREQKRRQLEKELETQNSVDETEIESEIPLKSTAQSSQASSSKQLLRRRSEPDAEISAGDKTIADDKRIIDIRERFENRLYPKPKPRVFEDEAEVETLPSQPSSHGADIVLKPPAFLAREQQKQEQRMKAAFEKEQEEERKRREADRERRRLIAERLEEIKANMPDHTPIISARAKIIPEIVEKIEIVRPKEPVKLTLEQIYMPNKHLKKKKSKKSGNMQFAEVIPMATVDVTFDDTSFSLAHMKHINRSLSLKTKELLSTIDNIEAAQRRKTLPTKFGIPKLGSTTDYNPQSYDATSYLYGND